jgi:uncharacterized protein
MKKDDPVDIQEQIQLIKSLAAEGNPKAQHNLGALYLSGEGVEKNLDNALHWFRLAAEQGLVVAQHNLGSLYLQGTGMPADPIEAVHWFLQAAMQGDPRSQYSLGALYFEGMGVDKNFRKSYIWLSLALQVAPKERQDEMRQVRDFVASQLSPEETEQAHEETLEILKQMKIH